jgi:hypothetical protein
MYSLMMNFENIFGNYLSAFLLCKNQTFWERELFKIIFQTRIFKEKKSRSLGLKSKTDDDVKDYHFNVQEPGRRHC